ncbi:MAG: endoglucanase, partial [Moraxellaceae bacterium]
MLKTDGTFWAQADGTRIDLKGTNIGNWLVQEFWMMGQGGNGVTDQCTLEDKLTERFGREEKEATIKRFRDSWFTERDWDQIKAFGFNVVRLPIHWNVIEDELNHKTLRADAWTYIDWSIAEAKERGIYVILDLHGAAGGQTPNDHTGCAGKNEYWTSADAQDRTRWLWQQIATRYKDEPVVAAYDPLNEPWGSTAEAMVVRINELYDVIRAIDPKHIIMLPSHYGSIDAYGDPLAKGQTNVAFEIHPYPGLFGDRPGDSHYMIHRDWLRCGADGLGGVCGYDAKMKALKMPLLVGEFQPWQSAGIELGGQIGRATYDTYASYGWASTSWSYKLVSAAGGQGTGKWGMVTNAVNPNNSTGLGKVAAATTWACPTWDASFANACEIKAGNIVVGGTEPKTFYFVIKTGALGSGSPDVSYDNISIRNIADNTEVITNGTFGSDTGWSVVNISGGGDLDFNYSTAGKTPTGSDGAVLHVGRPSPSTGTEVNVAIFQQVTLQGGQTYALNGLFKSNN